MGRDDFYILFEQAERCIHAGARHKDASGKLSACVEELGRCGCGCGEGCEGEDECGND